MSSSGDVYGLVSHIYLEIDKVRDVPGAISGNGHFSVRKLRRTLLCKCQTVKCPLAYVQTYTFAKVRLF